MLIFRDYDQKALDAQYDNRARVPEFATHVAAWKSGSDAARAALSAELDLPYGPDARQRLDIFPPLRQPWPVAVFIHGGYWRAMEKELFAFLAPAFVAAGVGFVNLEYRLCPAVGIGDIVADIDAALGWIATNIARFGGDPNHVHVMGHSAGGHLAALALSRHAGLRGAVAVSGLYELEPIRLSFLNADLRLDAGQARALSPLHALPQGPRGPLLLAVGGAESEEFHRQQRDYAAAWRAGRRPVLEMMPEGRDHFTVLSALGDPGQALFDAALRQILGPAP